MSYFERTTYFLAGFLVGGGGRGRQGSPEKDVEAEHGEHDGQVAQDANGIAQLVNEQEPLVHHPGDTLLNDRTTL